MRINKDIDLDIDEIYDMLSEHEKTVLASMIIDDLKSDDNRRYIIDITKNLADIQWEASLNKLIGNRLSLSNEDIDNINKIADTLL